MTQPRTANTVFFDLETPRLFEDVGGRFPERLGMAVAVTWDQENEYRDWFETNVKTLVQELATFERVVGFNVTDFDYPVLSAYEPSIFTLLSAKTVDMMDPVHSALGFRVSLADIAEATLGCGKMGTGPQAVALWRDGKQQEVVDYCRSDVGITRDIYVYGSSHGVIYYPSYGQRQPIPVSWAEALEEVTHQS